MDTTAPRLEFVAVACPLCGADESAELYRGRPLASAPFVGESVVVSQCSACGFAFNSPRPDELALAHFYASDPMASGSTFSTQEVGGYYPMLFAERAAFYAPFLQRWSRGDRPGRLLDIGCGQGGFLRALREALPAAWKLVGLEPSASSSAATRDAGFEVRSGYLGEAHFPADSFDAISLISVLEHLPQPAEAVAEAVRMLRPGGILLLEVPNTLHPELSLTSYFGFEHVNQFAPGSLAALLEAHGVDELRLDDRVRDHGLRLVASSDLLPWGCSDPESFGDDRHEVAAAVRSYAALERRLFESLDTFVGARLERWTREGRCFAVYGAGVHTIELTAHVDLSGASFLVDGNPSKQGTTLLGLPVRAPEALVARGVDAVLISSHRFADEMEATVRELCPEAEVARCYPPDLPLDPL